MKKSYQLNLAFVIAALATFGCEVDADLDGHIVTDAPDCGNGSIEIGEECDDHNTNDDDGCSSICKIEEGYYCNATGCEKLPVCGNGVLENDEECDLGSENGEPGSGCSSKCKKQPVCGDGVVEGNEACDKIDGEFPEWCKKGCQLEDGWYCHDVNECHKLDPNCGNGTIESGEDCDLGARNGKESGCSIDCKNLAGWKCEGDKCEQVQEIEQKSECGNGKIELGEQCDDGNSNNGCSNCIIDQGYACESVLNEDEETYKSVCRKIEEDSGECGNGKIELGEQCDDGNSNMGCTACRIEDGYKCESVLNEDGITYKSVCEKISEVLGECGNGTIESGEECDDGNTKGGDGCSHDCKTEPQFSCNNETKSVCRPICGDGIRVNWLTDQNLNEECELDEGGNLPSWCDEATCRIKEGWYLEEGEYKTHCGDGKVAGDEACDDGNKVAGDGCSPDCKVESLFDCSTGTCKPKCGDGVVVNWLSNQDLNEDCDLGIDGNFPEGCDANSCKQIEGYECKTVSYRYRQSDEKHSTTGLDRFILVKANQRYMRKYNGNGYDVDNIEAIASMIDNMPGACKDDSGFRYNDNKKPLGHPDFGNNVWKSDVPIHNELVGNIPTLDAFVENTQHITCDESFKLWFTNDDLGFYNKPMTQWLEFRYRNKIGAYRFMYTDFANTSYAYSNIYYNLRMDGKTPGSDKKSGV